MTSWPKSTALFFLSPATASLAGVYLAVEGLQDKKNRSGFGIAMAAGIVIASSLFDYGYNRSLRARTAKRSARIYGRLLDLIGSLGELSGDRYDCWKVELYLAHWRLGPSRRFPWVMVRALIRSASVNVAATRNLRDTPDLIQAGPVGWCFKEARPAAWFHPLSEVGSDLDTYGQLSQACDRQLMNECGAMRLTPVVSQLNSNCIGVLCVHTEPRHAPTLAGTAVTDQFARRVLDAAVDLHVIAMGQRE